MAVSSERTLRYAVLALLAPAGVLVGHALAYVMAIPDPNVRQLALSGPTHVWWKVVLPVAAGLVAAGVVMAGRLAGSPGTKVSGSGHCGWLASRLAIVQCVLFVGVEVAERLVVHQGLDLIPALVSHGAVAQVVVAMLMTLVLWSLARTVVAVLRLAGGTLHSRPAVAAVATAPVFGCGWRPAYGSLGARGPPAGSVRCLCSPGLGATGTA